MDLSTKSSVPGNHGIMTSPYVNMSLSCDLCDEVVANLKELETHRLIHFASDKYTCPVCQKVFASSTNMRYHLATHTNEKKYECKYCKKRFNWRSQLITHEHIHTGKGLYYCPLCSKSCMTKWLLTRHIKVHAKDGTVDIDEILKQDFRRSPLAIASIDSSSSETAKDEIASDGFANGSAGQNPASPALDNDNKPTSIIDTSSKKFRCTDCGDGFDSQELMATHLLEHLTGNRYQCKNCGVVYTKLARLRKHSLEHPECSASNAGGYENFIPDSSTPGPKRLQVKRRTSGRSPPQFPTLILSDEGNISLEDGSPLRMTPGTNKVATSVDKCFAHGKTSVVKQETTLDTPPCSSPSDSNLSDEPQEMDAIKIEPREDFDSHWISRLNDLSEMQAIPGARASQPQDRKASSPSGDQLLVIDVENSSPTKKRRVSRNGFSHKPTHANMRGKHNQEETKKGNGKSNSVPTPLDAGFVTNMGYSAIPLGYPFPPSMDMINDFSASALNLTIPTSKTKQDHTHRNSLAAEINSHDLKGSAGAGISATSSSDISIVNKTSSDANASVKNTSGGDMSGNTSSGGDASGSVKTKTQSDFNMQLLQALEGQFTKVMMQMAFHHQQQMAVQAAQIVQLQTQLEQHQEKSQTVLSRMEQRLQGLEMVITAQSCAIAADHAKKNNPRTHNDNTGLNAQNTGIGVTNKTQG